VDAQDCIFCKIIDGQIPATKIYENQNVVAFLDIGPVSEGHTLLVHKTHTCTLAETEPDMMCRLVEVLPLLAGAIQKAMHADGYNVLCNNGRAAGQLVDHLHFHIIPRKNNDSVFNRWPKFEYPQGRAEEISQKIIQNL
jgi:histidine triad (HIT) family protein